MSLPKMQEKSPWSYSRLSSYEHCPMSYKLSYVDKVPQVNNAYAEYGSYCHAILEEFARGNLMSFELASKYKDGYDKQIISYFPPYPKGLSGRYFEQGLQYFDTFDGFGDNYEILAIEERANVEIGGESVTGIIDLLLEDKNTGELVIVDHKTKAIKEMTKGLQYAVRQLYMYSCFVAEKYKRYPSLLRYNMLRYGEIIEIPFQTDAYLDTLAWITNTIAQINNDKTWEAKPSKYFCQHICGSRYECSEAQSRFII